LRPCTPFVGGCRRQLRKIDPLHCKCRPSKEPFSGRIPVAHLSVPIEEDDAFRSEIGNVGPVGRMEIERRDSQRPLSVAGRSSMAAAIAPSNCWSETGLVNQSRTPSESAEARAC